MKRPPGTVSPGTGILFPAMTMSVLVEPITAIPLLLIMLYYIIPTTHNASECTEKQKLQNPGRDAHPCQSIRSTSCDLAAQGSSRCSSGNLIAAR